MTRLGTNHYNNPNFLIMRYSTPVAENQQNGSISCAGSGATIAFVGSTLKVYNKAVVTGVQFQVQSGAGSAVGTNSICVTRLVAGGAASAWQKKLVTTSLGASMAGDVIDISLASGLTLGSLGDSALLDNLVVSNHMSVVIKNIVWRYRMLPQEMEYADSP